MKSNKRKGNEDTKNQIIAVAVDMIFKSGYQKASLRDIGRHVGITQAAIYYHFRNKEEILYTIIEDASNHLLLSLMACVSKERDPIQKLKKAVLMTIGIMKTEKKKVKIVIEDKRLLGPELQVLVKEKEKAVYRFYLNLMEEIKEQGKLKEIELTTAVFAILGQINWLYHWFRPEGNLKIEDVAENIVKMIMFGVIKE